MMQLQCSQCRHYLNDFKCEAYPNGIPDKILSGTINHVNNIKGDNGIKYEPLTIYSEKEQKEIIEFWQGK